MNILLGKGSRVAGDGAASGAVTPDAVGQLVRFGTFELDLSTSELTRNGRRVSLQNQPARVLCLLVLKAGQLVTRDELHRTLWSADTFVEFETALNIVVTKIRHALGDSAASPRFIETIPRRGYRFIADVHRVERSSANAPASAMTPAANEAASGGSDAARAEPEDRRLRVPRLRTLSGRRGARWIGLVVGSIAVAVAGPFAVNYLSRTGRSPRLLRPVPVTSLPGIEASPAVSPDGNQVAFLHGPSNSWGPGFQLYVQPIGATHPLRLTHGKGDAGSPTWSPDGRHLAFLRHPDLAKNHLLHDIIVVPATGGAERSLGTVIGGHGLSWSPDGRSLAVVDRRSEQEPFAIYLLSLEAGGKQRLTSPPAGYAGDCFPRFSPDGQSLAFVRLRSQTQADVYVLNLARRTLARVISDNNVYGGLDWTPDGASIVFASGPLTLFHRLWKVPATGGVPEAIEVEEGFEPSTSRRNRPLLVFARFQLDWNVWRVAGPLANRPEASPRRIIDSTQLDLLPRYSPDGKNIAFISRRSGTTEVWTARSDGTSPVRLTFLGRDDLEMDVDWSPDGQQLVFTASSAGGNYDMYLIAAQGGLPERVTATPEDERFPSFSRDGRWIYFTSRKGGREPQIWKRPRAGGTTVQVTRHGGVAGRESPDGRFLYFAKRDETGGPLGIWRMSLTSGHEEQIVEQGVPRWWDVYDRGVCYGVLSPEGSGAIECYDVLTRTVTRLGVFETAPLRLGFSLSPDGQSILITRVDKNESDLMMIENFE
jgi:Tol biopolymer transport system component/DNA-binding winged helix-turn-helix (wHTH) protein